MGAGSDGPAAGELVALEQLLERAHSSAPADLGAAVERAAAALGAPQVRLLLVDFQQELLTPLTAEGRAGEAVPVTGTLAGRAFTTGAPVALRGDTGDAPVVTPLLDGIERLGVLELTVDDASKPAVAACRRFADLVTQFLSTKGRYTDEFHVARQREPMSLAAQMLPPLTAHAPAVTVAGQVEPAYHVGGDAFDYAINREVAHLAVFDAMGHGVPASVTTALAMGAYCNCRRRGIGLVDTVSHLHEVLESEFADDRYVTAVLGELDLSSGVLHLVSAGHPAPLLLRARQVVGTLDIAPVTPLGMSLALPPGAARVREVVSSLGDRVLFVTDGIADAQDGSGRRFGEVRLVDLVERAALDETPLPELARGVYAYQHGDLTDDASLLLV